jgi:hypothetical protein
MGGSAAEEEKRRTGGTWFDRIWNSLFAMKDVTLRYTCTVCVTFRFRGTVVCEPGHTVMFAKSPPVVPRRHGNSIFFSLIRYFDYLQSNRWFSTLHTNSIRLRDHLILADLLACMQGTEPSVNNQCCHQMYPHLPPYRTVTQSVSLSYRRSLPHASRRSSRLSILTPIRPNARREIFECDNTSLQPRVQWLFDDKLKAQKMAIPLGIR